MLYRCILYRCILYSCVPGISHLLSHRKASVFPNNFNINKRFIYKVRIKLKKKLSNHLDTVS